MIALLRDLPIRRKLTVITMVTTGFTLALACAAFTVYDQLAQRRDLESELTSTARMIGYNSSSALSFNDAASATETLRSLSAQRNITAAWLHGRDGLVFARYFRDGETTQLTSPTVRSNGPTFARDAVELVSAIDSDGEVIGTIHLQSDLARLHQRLMMSATIFLGVMLGGGVIAYLFVLRLQRVISQPIQQLADVAGRVATRNDYAVRAVKQGNDEIGTLIDGFNAMLTQIQTRDEALQQAREDLEKRVEARTHELASSVSLLNATLDSTTDGIIATNHAGEIVCCNSRFVAMWNVPSSLLAQRRSSELLKHAHGQVSDPVRFAQLVAQPPGSSGAAVGEIVELLDGRTFERYVHPQRVDGREVGVVVSYRNVTERRRAEEQVARERARFKFIFDSVPVGISLIVPDDDMPPIVNPAHSRITGIDPSQLQDPAAFERASHPDDFARQRELVRRYKRGEIDQFSLEKRYIHSDGSIVWASLSRRMFLDPKTGQRQSVTAVIDISELKAAQEAVARERARFKFIFDSVPVGISLVAVGQSTHLVNPAHVRITGVSVEDSSRPGMFASVSHPDDLRHQNEFIKRYVSGEIDHYTVEKRYLHRDGRIVWASLTSRLFTDPLTGHKQSITTLVDLTERKTAESRLAETHKQLLDTSRQAGMAEVATGVLHNVGNVLNSVNVSTTVLTDLVRTSKIDNIAKLGLLFAEHEADPAAFFANDPRARKIPGFVQTLAKHLAQEQRLVMAELDSLRKSVEHIKEIVAMQQSYAKVSGVSDTVPVVDLIEDALRMNAGAMVHPEVGLVREFGENPDVTVDKHKVLQILVNLLRNAKYACDDAARTDKQIIVRSTVESGVAKIAVIDNGVGIPPENLTRIFSHGFTTRKHGHGFGLHSGALAAKELGGRLIALSEGPGRGATFVLELPLKVEAKAA